MLTKLFFWNLWSLLLCIFFNWDFKFRAELGSMLFDLKWSEVAQSCPTLCDPMDGSLPGSSVHGIFQARILEGLPFPSLYLKGDTKAENGWKVVASCPTEMYLLGHPGNHGHRLEGRNAALLCLTSLFWARFLPLPYGRNLAARVRKMKVQVFNLRFHLYIISQTSIKN